MAKLIQKNNEPSVPEPDNSGSKIAAILFLLSAIACGVIFIATKSVFSIVLGGVLLAVAFIVWLVSIAAGTDFTSAKKRYGDAGERQTGYMLEQILPEEFTIVQNAVVTYEGGHSEIDNIVIGKTGVFIIEVKNMKGDIYGDYESRYWLQDKTDRYGIDHQKDLYSPVKQVGTHIYRLANFLRDNKIFTHISGAVYFVNPETDAIIKGEPKDIPVFDYDSTQEMINYIMNGNANLSGRTVERIIQLLNEKTDMIS